MVKQITDLTLSDFQNVYTLNDHIRIATNIPNLNPVLLGNRRTGYRIRMFSNASEIPKFKSIYVAPQLDIYASNTNSILRLPEASYFREIENLESNVFISTDTLNVGGNWFNNNIQHIVWAYFVIDETPHFTGTITNSLHDSTTYTKDDKDIITLKANDGYKIKNASLDYQPYPGAGSQSLGDFAVSSDKLTATINIPDNVKNDKTINLTISGETSIEQKLKVQYQYNSSLVNVTTTTGDYQVNIPFTLNATPSIGYTYDKVDNIFSVLPSDNVSIIQDGTKATITLPDKQTYTITLKDPTKLPTQKKVYFSDYNYTIYIPNDTRGINGTGTTKDGFKVVPTSDVTLTNEVASTIFADINGDSNNTAVARLSDNNLIFDNFTYKQWSDLTTSHIRDNNGNLIYNLQDYVNQLKPKFTGAITSKIQGVNATINNMTGVITVNIPDNSTLTGSINILDGTGKTVTSLEIKNNSATVPTQYTSNNFELVGSLVYSTNYKVNISQVKDFVDYTTNQLTITLTAKDKIIINSLHAVADLSWSGESYALKDDMIKIDSDKKTATITVPNDYNSKLGYTIVITGDFSKLTPPPVNPSGTNSIHVYQLDDDTLTKFSTQAIEYFKGGTNTVYDFQKFITQLYKLPFNIPENESTGTTNIRTGWFTVNEPARKLNKTRYILDLGIIKVINVNNNGFDHNIKSCTLYLPFISPLSVSYETILNHNLNVKYDTDLLTGKTTVNIFVDNELLNSFQTNINENLDLYNIYNDSINGSLSSILENTLDHCFVKVEYYQPIDNLVSYETNEHGTLKDYTGYTQTKNVILSKSINSTIDNLIISNLNSGVIIK